MGRNTETNLTLIDVTTGDYKYLSHENQVELSNSY